MEKRNEENLPWLALTGKKKEARGKERSRCWGQKDARSLSPEVKGRGKDPFLGKEEG